MLLGLLRLVIRVSKEPATERRRLLLLLANAEESSAPETGRGRGGLAAEQTPSTPSSK